MAPTKKTPKRPLKAAKPPVLNLKATEVKSGDNKSDNKSAIKTPIKPAPDAPKTADKKPTGDKVTSDKKINSKTTDKKTTQNDPGKKKSTGSRTLVLVSLAALIAAGLGGAWAFKTYGAGYFSSPDTITSAQLATAISRIEKLEANKGNNEGEKITQLINEIETRANQNSATLLENAKKLATLEKTASQIRIALAKAVEESNGPVAVANELQYQQLNEKLGQLEQNLTKIKTTPINDLNPKIAEIQTRFDALAIRLGASEEQTLATSKSIEIIKTAQEKLISSPGSNPASELARAFTIMRAQITQGVPFETSLDNIAGTLPQETALDTLRPFAKTGAPTLDQLKTVLTSAQIADSNKLASDEKKPVDNLLGTITNRLSGLVKVTKVGETDWLVLKQEATKALTSGQISTAIKSLSKGANTPTDIKKWLALAGQKASVDKAIDRLSQTVMAQLTAGTN